MVETVEFNGIKFRRYPNATARSDRVYFTPGIADKQRGTGRLHEEIWKATHGTIPNGFHIHHKDGDSLNNSLENLECIHGADHIRHHHGGVCSDRKREHLEKIGPLAAAWHRSPAGRAWHRQHAYVSIRTVQPAEHTCEHCGKPYTTLPKAPNRFCTNACKSAWRRKAGLDNEDRQCEVCGLTFRANRYAKKRACSRKCAGVLISRAKTSRP